MADLLVLTAEILGSICMMLSGAFILFVIGSALVRIIGMRLKTKLKVESNTGPTLLPIHGANGDGKAKPKHPIQPLLRDEDGIIRFKANAIVQRMLYIGRDREIFDLDSFATLSFSNEDWEQLAQLIGYSLSGFEELSYVSDETYSKAESSPVFGREQPTP